MDKIRTTHVGSLPRPHSLLKMMQAKYSGDAPSSAELETLLRQEVENVVARQVEIGIDCVSDGEYSKPSYATYIAERLDGFGGEFRGHAAQDLRDYPAYAKHLIEIGGVMPSAGGMCCQGPVKVKSADELEKDLGNLANSVEVSKPDEAFMNAASPGVIAVFQKNEFYKSEDDYIEAVVEAMRPEYEAIVNAGFLLQLDCPDLAMGRHLSYSELTDLDFLKIAVRNIEALNEALKNIPSEAHNATLFVGDIVSAVVEVSGPTKLRLENTLYDESIQILEGTLILTPQATGKSEKFVAGDTLVLPKGFSGTWEMIGEPFRELIVAEAKTLGEDMNAE